VYLSKKENKDPLPTGTFLVRWDNNEFVLSYIHSDKEKEKEKEKKKKVIVHVSTTYDNVRDLFENEKEWKKKHNLKSVKFPERPLGFLNLEGVWFNKLYISSGTTYTFNLEGGNPAQPTAQEQLNLQRGLPAFEIVL